MNRLPLWSRIAIVPLTIAILALAAARIIGGSDSAPSWQQPPESDEGTLLFVTEGTSGPAIRSLIVEAEGPVTDTVSPAASDGDLSIPPGCVVGGQWGSPNGKRVVIGIDCEYGSYTRILDLNTAQVRSAEPELGQDSIFLG